LSKNTRHSSVTFLFEATRPERKLDVRQLVIPSQFGIASGFSEGLAQVCIGTCEWAQNAGYSGKFGFIDRTGHFVVNPQYDDVENFRNGFAKVTLGKGNEEKDGYIDKTGKVIWQPSN
jgi:hypothetical protein